MTPSSATPEGWVSRLEFRVLGPLQVLIGGRPHSLGRRRLNQLVLALLIEAGTPVSADRLMDALWGDQPPASGTAAVHNLVGGLRRRLADLVPDERQLVSTGPEGYVLSVRAEQVDTHQFELLHSEGATALQAGDVEEAAVRFEAALALWRGVPFHDAAGRPFVHSPAARLEELRRTVEEDLADAHLRQDRPAAAARLLQALVAAEPLRERRWELYILALYRAGRQRDALAAYDEVRTHLHDELGADPGPALLSLQRAVLRHEPALLETVGPAPVRRGRRELRPLPSPVSSLLGRGEEIAAVSQLLSKGRLATVTGPGGVGKTRVAIAVARALTERFPGGTAFVPLGPLRDPTGVLRSIAASLGLRDELPEITPEAITGPLDGQPVLIVLDTLEHLPGARAAVAALLASSDTVSVLATSRSPLRLSGEQRFPLTALPVPAVGVTDLQQVAANPSVALFVERARAHDPAFGLDASNAPAVAAWCRHLGGLPLAIELAAARVADAGGVFDAPVPALDDLSTSPVDVPPRQRSLRATLDWSVSQLSDDARRLFRRLSVFRGMPDLPAITAVGAEVAPALDELVRLSLAIPQVEGGSRRMTMLDMVCAYAREQLPEREAIETRRRHAAHYLGVAEAANATTGGATSLDALDPDANDLLAALQYLRDAGAHDQAARLVVAMHRWWQGRGDVAGGLREATAVLDAAGGRLRADLAAQLHTCIGSFAAALGDDEGAARHHAAAQECWRHRESTGSSAPAPHSWC